MASTSAVEESSEQVYEEETEEETVWMDEDEAHLFVENEKKLRMSYGSQGLRAQDGDATEEYQEVDVEEYEESGHNLPLVNLPDLISRRYQVGNDVFTFCFSKQGVHQLSSNGYLYNFVQQDSSNATWTCINPECTAHILTTLDMDSIERGNDVHSEMCVADEKQLNLRIGIYDLRLLAEFTDTNLEVLYNGYVGAFAQGESADVAELFPSFEALQRSLKEHRRYKFYKRAFDKRYGIENGEKRLEEEIDLGDHSMLLSLPLGEEEVVEESYAERVPREGELAIRAGAQLHMHPYGRTRGWPPTFCAECGVDMPSSSGRSGTFSPQHALVQHVSRLHSAIKINACVFDPSAFEMWLREVQRCQALRFRRFSLIGEDFYYLCSCDSRLPRNKFSTGVCCTAYIKITDFREVSARRARLVSIEYCFDHFSHDLTIEGVVPADKLIADMRPDEFLFQMERRKMATANLVRSRQELLTKKSFIANSIGLRSTTSSRVPENVFSTSRSESRTAVTRQVATAAGKVQPGFRLPPPIPAGMRPAILPGGGMITKRMNFKDQGTFEAVKQFEQCSYIAIRRLQNVKSTRVACQYAEGMRRIADRIQGDPDCAPEGSAAAVWRGALPARNGKHPASKRPKEEEVEDIEEEEGERKRLRMGEEGGEKGKEGALEKGETAKDDSTEAAKKRGGRSQLPVRSTLVATGRVVVKEKKVVKPKEGEEEKKGKVVEKEKEKEGEKEEPPTPSTSQPARKSAASEKKEEEKGRSLPQAVVRSKSSRIQARKEKVEGESEGKKE